jgi:hypothetical protein
MEKKMKSAALSNGSGPGSSIALSPTSIRVRDAIIEKFIDKSLDELNIFLTSALDTERDESKRIGILAARVYILRTRISKIIEFNQNTMIPSIDNITPNELVNKLQHFDEPIMSDEPSAENINHLEEWNELLTLEDGEINGVRIPRGVAITVGRDDASRLIETGKAELIKEEKTAENTADEQDAIPDAPDMETEVEIEAAEQMPIEQTDETSEDEEETLSKSAVQDTEAEIEAAEQMPPEQIDETPEDEEETLSKSVVKNTEAEIKAAEQMPAEQTDEISVDYTEPAPETKIENSDMSAAKMTASDVETKPQDPSSSEDTQTDDVDEAEIDETKPQT